MDIFFLTVISVLLAIFVVYIIASIRIEHGVRAVHKKQDKKVGQ